MKSLARILILTVLAFAMNVAYGQQPMPLGPYGQIPAVATNTNATATATTFTFTPGQMSTVFVSLNSGGAVTAATTPTAAQLCQLFPFVQASGASNFHWDWYLVNAGANTITVALGANVSATTGYTGTLATVAASVKHFMIVLTNCVAGSETAQLLSFGTSVF